MKFSKLRFAAVGILLGTSGLVVSCGGGNAVTPVSEPQPATQRESPHKDAGCILDFPGDDGAPSPQPTLSKPRQTDGIDDASIQP
jgi:hypothetical protein